MGLKTVSDRDEIMLISEKGMIVRSPIKDIRTTGRSTQGVRLIKLDSGDKLASVAKIVPEDEDEPLAPTPDTKGARGDLPAENTSKSKAEKSEPKSEKKRTETGS